MSKKEEEKYTPDVPTDKPLGSISNSNKSVNISEDSQSRDTTESSPRRIIAEPSRVAALDAQKKGLKLPTSRGTVSNVVQTVSSTQSIMDDAKDTLAKEIYSFKAKSFTKGLDMKEARVFTQLIESLIKLSKEERESTKAEDLSQKSDEELLKEIKELMGAVKGE